MGEEPNQVAFQLRPCYPVFTDYVDSLRLENVMLEYFKITIDTL